MTTTTIRKTLSHTPFQALVSVGALLACLMIPQHAQAQYYNGRNNNAGYHQDNRHDDHRYNNRGGRLIVEHRPVIIRPIIVSRPTPIYYYPQQYYNYTPASVVVYNEPVRYVETQVVPVQTGYIVGDRLINGEVVPQDIAVQLRPAPRGYFYRMQGQRVYLVRQNDNVIAQIFDSLLGGSLL